MRTVSGPVTVHQLTDSQAWIDTGVVVDDRAASTADVLYEGGKVYLTSRVASGAMEVVRMSFDPSTHFWRIDNGFPVSPTTSGSESASIARDTGGRLWVTWTAASRVWVSHSTTSDLAWTAPFTVPVPDTAVAADDLSAIVAFSGKVGIMWSDQASTAFRFAVHADGQPDGVWTMETPLAGPGLADDHINIKSLLEDDAGRIFAAVKTSKGDAGEPSTEPLIMVLSRTANGTWTSAVAGRVADKLTRPQLALDRTNRQLYLLATSPTNGGGIVYYKHTSLTNISFAGGLGQPFISWPGVRVNNVATAKNPVDATTGLVALATDDTNFRYYHARLDLSVPAPADTAAPSVPAGVQAVASAPDRVDAAWQASTDNVGVTGYRVLRDGVVVTTVAGTAHTDVGLSAGATYAYTVEAIDAAGNRSASSAPVSVTTPVQPPPVSGTLVFHGATTTTSTGGTSAAAPRPGGTVSGDVLITVVSMRGQPTITPPAGWTLVRRDDNDTTTMRQAIYTTTVTTGSPASWKFRVSRSISTVVQVLAYAGVDTANPVVAHAGLARSGTGTLNAPAVTAPAGSTVIGVLTIARATTLTEGLGLVERTEATNTGSSRLTTHTVETTTSTGPLRSTATGAAATLTQTLALRPQGA